MTHYVNNRARVRVDWLFSSLPYYIYEYRLLVFRLGPIRIRRWKEVQATYYTKPYQMMPAVALYFEQQMREESAKRRHRRQFFKQFNSTKSTVTQ